MTERLHAVALTPSEVESILAICSPRGLLVGGQALAFWADHLGVARPGALVPFVTADADFIGDSTLARDLGRELGWKTWIPTLDDATPNTGKVTSRDRQGGVKEVDFLSGVVGLTTKDIVRRAVEVRVPKIGTLRVMHPIDVLDSRIQNLHLLAEKQNDVGVAQAKLALDVARAYVAREVRTEGERAALKLLERIVDIARDIASTRVFLRWAIDPLDAVPLDDFRTTPALHKKRWPQIRRDVATKRKDLAALVERKSQR